LLQTEDEFMYLAPESGYTPQLEMQFHASDTSWAPMVKAQFFIRTRNGQAYGRVELEVNSIYNHKSAIEVNFSMNPAGSRNLE
jgi:hypothetical protein